MKELFFTTENGADETEILLHYIAEVLKEQNIDAQDWVEIQQGVRFYPKGPFEDEEEEVYDYWKIGIKFNTEEEAVHMRLKFGNFDRLKVFLYTEVYRRYDEITTVDLYGE